jgi:hypothetical protein
VRKVRGLTTFSCAYPRFEKIRVVTLIFRQDKDWGRKIFRPIGLCEPAQYGAVTCISAGPLFTVRLIPSGSGALFTAMEGHHQWPPDLQPDYGGIRRATALKAAAAFMSA